MKSAVLLILPLIASLAPLAWGAPPNPAEYSIKVHVSSARTEPMPCGAATEQQQLLSATINGERYELLGATDGSLLSLGDYKAKLVQNEHKTPYESFQVYEFLLPDNLAPVSQTVRFQVVGHSE